MHRDQWLPYLLLGPSALFLLVFFVFPFVDVFFLAFQNSDGQWSWENIVTMREDNNSQVFTVNLKAPLLIDSAKRTGRQHVFAGEHYPLRHPLQANDRNEG